jgi:putative ABC transport system permease protein
MNILNKLTVKHLKMNRKRTIVTIIGVLLSTALMVGIGLLFSTVRDYAVKEVVARSGSYHIKLLDVDYEKMNVLKQNIAIKEVLYEKGIGFAEFKQSDNMYKPYIYVDSGNDEFLKNLKLIKGNLPQNGNEVVVSEHILSEHKFQIGDIINLDMGVRIYQDEEITSNSEGFKAESAIDSGETFEITGSMEYKVVGIVERSFYESYSAPGYQIYTKSTNVQNDELVNIYFTYKNVSKVYDKTENLLKVSGINNSYEQKNLEYNDALLAVYGESKYSNLTDSFIGIILIILTLVSIGCIIVIYNSFAISVMERKKQFGLFSSIGATKDQLRKTVFYEAFIVGLIGIPLGILSGFFGIWVVINVINQLLPEAIAVTFSLSVYPLFIIIPIVFMIVVLIFSAYLPAVKASKITPIEAIRLNDDIKIKSKKVKTNKLVSKLFGVEAEIALKNMKRNKRKYRITIVSLFMSIVLFISFSSLLIYATRGSSEYLDEIDFDISVGLADEDKELLENTIKDIIISDEVDKYIVVRSNYNLYTKSLSDNDYHKDYQKVLENQDSRWSGDIPDTVWNYIKSINLVSIDNKNYQSFLKELNLKQEQPILINYFNSVVYSSNNRKVYEGRLLKSKKEWEFSICPLQNIIGNAEASIEEIDCSYKINNVYETTKLPFGLKFATNSSQPIIVVSEEMYDKIISETAEKTEQFYNIFIKADKYTNIDKKLNDYASERELQQFYYTNIVEQQKMTRNLILIIKILFYGFISLVTLIGVTSVFNTINTGIALRRTEFAVLRSMGLTPKGFNRILRFETLIVGLKALLYSIPVSLGVVYLIDRSMGEIVSFSDIILPWKSILFAVIGVFIIVSITMKYASSKIKNENILDAIREENI